MKIKEIEERTGISSHNIRFYEKEKLIVPERNPINGYREYTENDVELLKRIKLLRMLDIPVSDIRECIERRKNLPDILIRHLDSIKAEENRIRQNHLLCEQLADMEMDNLPADLIEQIFHDKDAYLYQLERLKKQDRIKSFIFLSKQVVCILGWLVAIIICMLFYFELCTTYMSRSFQIITCLMVVFLFGCIVKMIHYNEKK